MVVSRRAISSTLTAISSLWCIFLAAAAFSGFGMPLRSAQPAAVTSWVLLIFGSALLIDSGLCLTGARAAYYAALSISVLLIVSLLLGGNPLANLDYMLGILLSAIAVVSNASVLRTRKKIPEQSHPLNLPVFG